MLIPALVSSRRLSDSSLKIPEERAAKVATRIERELFSFFRDTDSKYKNKYRSLMFNLKDPKNNVGGGWGALQPAWRDVAEKWALESLTELPQGCLG